MDLANLQTHLQNQNIVLTKGKRMIARLTKMKTKVRVSKVGNDRLVKNSTGSFFNDEKEYKCG